MAPAFIPTGRQLKGGFEWRKKMGRGRWIRAPPLIGWVSCLFRPPRLAHLGLATQRRARQGVVAGLFLHLGGGGRLAANGLGNQTGIRPYRSLDMVGDIRVIKQELLGVFPALANALVTAREPGAGFLDHAGLEQRALTDQIQRKKEWLKLSTIIQLTRSEFRGSLPYA